MRYARLGRLVSEGTIEFEGETIRYRWYRGERLREGGSTKGFMHYIEADYDEPISINDNGNGLDYAIILLRNELANQKRRRKLKQR